MCDGPEFNPRFKHGCGHPPPPFMGRDIAGVIQGIMGHMKDCRGSFEGWVPNDMEEMEDCFKVIVPLPGLAKEDVKVTLISGCLNISTTKPKSDEEESEKGKHGKHHGMGPLPFIGNLFTAMWDKEVNLEVPLPPTADENNIKSVMKNGLLKVRIGKKPAKKIDISDEKE